MKRISIFLMLTVLGIFQLFPQTDTCADSVIALNVNEKISNSDYWQLIWTNYYLAFSSYLYSYIEIPDDIDCFMDYINHSKLFSSNFSQYALENKKYTQIHFMDSTSTLLLRDSFLMITLPNLYYDFSVEGAQSRMMIKLFETNGHLCQKNHLYVKFKRIRHAFFSHNNYGKPFRHYYSSEVNCERLVIVLYSFTEENGLSIIAGGQNHYILKCNNFSNSLSNIAENFSKKHSLSKIIFAGPLPTDDSELLQSF